MKMMRLPQATLMLGALFVGSAVQAKHNFSVDSVNQPVVGTDRAVVPNCPNWKTGGLDSAAVTNSNYGCAINSNLAAMIADPNDLVLGQAGSAAGDPSTAAKAIKTYRDAKPTGASGLTATNTARSSN